MLVYRKRWLHSIGYASVLHAIDNNFDKVWGGGYKTFRSRLTKYCRGCVPGIPGDVDAYAQTVSYLTFIKFNFVSNIVFLTIFEICDAKIL